MERRKLRGDTFHETCCIGGVFFQFPICKAEESTRLACTGFSVELEHLKIETTLINEMSASVTGECEFLK